MSDFYCTFKYIVIGDSGVGKTSLRDKYTHDKFDSYIPQTLGMEFATHTVEIDGKQIKLEIHDTGGQETYRAITRSYYRGNAGALLVYDITRKASFDHLEMWLEDLKKHTDIGMMVTMLVGNKCDLEAEREVTYEEGLAFAEEHGLLFMETSAKTAANVERAFVSTANEIYGRTQSGYYFQKNGIRFGSQLPTAFTENRGGSREQRIVLHDDRNITPRRRCRCRRT